MSDPVLVALITYTVPNVFALIIYFLNNNRIKKSSESKVPTIEIFNDIDSAYACFFEKIKEIKFGKKHIKKLKIYATNSATKARYFIGKDKAIIDECIILLRRLPKGHEIKNEIFDKNRETQKELWKGAPNIEHLSIIEYDRISDIWYVICDDKYLMTDLLPYDFCEKDNKLNHSYYISVDKKPIVVSDKEYILQYIKHFDNYEKYYNKNGKTVFKRLNGKIFTDK